MDTPRTRLVLVRHGQTDANAAGRFQGHQDVPLNRIGRAQAEAVGQRLLRLDARRVITSDLTRAVATGEAIAAASGAVVGIDARLREVDVGSWQGKTFVEISAENPWYERAIADGRDFRRSATGETGTEAGERVAGALRRIAAEHPGETTVVVGHGFSLRVGLALLTGIGFENSFALSGLWNCSWSIVELGDRWRLVSYNNVVVPAGPGH